MDGLPYLITVYIVEAVEQLLHHLLDLAQTEFYIHI